ncbi:MAG: hypothetical protein AAGF93_06680 [Cyanobacteria bacterium P01_H01_bin.105]
MWQKLNNYVRNIETYRDMSPDLSVREQVNQSLRQHRRPLSSAAWCEECYRVTQASLNTLLFVYHALETYSGLEFNRVRPQDHLVNDLQFPMVCWFDWSASFCDDIVTHFGIDISDCFDETRFDTLTDLIMFLDSCIASRSSPAS